MSSFYKHLDKSQDITNTRTLLHEAIPLTGTIVSGTYGTANIKDYAHGMFQSVYDYPYLSSSANHIFDIAIGVSANSGLHSGVTSQKNKKRNVYNQMAQVLMGFDHNGTVQRFDEDGNLIAGGTKLDNVFFLNFSRLLVKDEIKKGSFQIELGVETSYSQNGGVFDKRIKLTDASGSDGYLVNSPAGEYGILYAQTTFPAGSTPRIHGETVGTATTHPACGLIFYQAGIVVLSGSVFNDQDDGGILHNTNTSTSTLGSGFGATGFNSVTGSTVSVMANNIRNRIYNIQFNNTVELNSTIYKCRIHSNDFNYSSNPTYLSGSEIRVKDSSTDDPIAYITTIGLYNSNNELMAVAKLSEPLKKDPSQEYTIRCRLDY